MDQHLVLVADEDKDTRVILRALLERNNCVVLDAGDAATAARLADSQPISLVILNHPISVREDLTLAEWLRRHERHARVPIINLTSRAVPGMLAAASRAGVTVNLAKPIDVYQMLDLVKELTTGAVAV